MSDSSRVQVAYIAESTFATQVTGSNLQIARITSENLKQDTTIVNSQEIRSDRQIADVRRTRVQASGPVNIEMSYGSHDDWLLAALMAASWSSPVVVGPAITIAFVAAGNHITDSGSGLASIVVNQWIKVSGATTAANNGYFKVLTVAAGDITVSGGTLVDESAAASVTINMGAQAVNGTTLTTYNVEKSYLDLSNQLSLLLGMAVNGFNFNVPVDGIITGAFDWVGSTEQSLTSSGGTGYTAAGSNSVLSAVEDVTAIIENAASYPSNGYTLRLQNNLEPRLQIGTLGAVSIRSGTVDVTGTLQAYFATATAMDKYLNFTSTNLAIAMEDTSGNGILVDLPEVKFTNGDRVAGGTSQDVIANLEFSAFRDSTEDITIRIAKFAA